MVLNASLKNERRPERADEPAKQYQREQKAGMRVGELS